MLLARAALPSPLVLHPQLSALDFDLSNALSPARVIDVTEAGSLPANCASYVGPAKDCAAEVGMRAMVVTFEDCGAAFTVCRCSDAEMSTETVLDRLGRVPIGLRRFVGTVVVASAADSHAYTLTNGDMHLFGDCGVNTWVHEATHSYDFATATTRSSSAGWTDAILADSCVPDNYALTNAVEAFAQLGVLKTFMILYDGHPPPNFSADCMSHQLDYMDTLPIYKPETYLGNTCVISDGEPGRHAIAPKTLASSRVFSTISVDWSVSSAVAALENVLPLDSNPGPAANPMLETTAATTSIPDPTARPNTARRHRPGGWLCLPALFVFAFRVFSL